MTTMHPQAQGFLAEMAEADGPPALDADNAAAGLARLPSLNLR